MVFTVGDIILPDLIYQNPRNYGSIVYMWSCGTYIINSSTKGNQK